MSMETGNHSNDAVRDVHFHLQKPIIFLNTIELLLFWRSGDLHRDKFLK